MNQTCESCSCVFKGKIVPHARTYSRDTGVLFVFEPFCDPKTLTGDLLKNTHYNRYGVPYSEVEAVANLILNCEHRSPATNEIDEINFVCSRDGDGGKYGCPNTNITERLDNPVNTYTPTEQS